MFHRPSWSGRSSDICHLRISKTLAARRIFHRRNPLQALRESYVVDCPLMLHSDNDPHSENHHVSIEIYGFIIHSYICFRYLIVIANYNWSALHIFKCRYRKTITITLTNTIVYTWICIYMDIHMDIYIYICIYGYIFIYGYIYMNTYNYH